MRCSRSVQTHVEVRNSGKGQSPLKAWTNSLDVDKGGRPEPALEGDGETPRCESWYKAHGGGLRWPARSSFIAPTRAEKC
ncbi:hypothetical protein J6590_021160 [Homalodisca vitripennis]|nr:hypothetical protein J6590_021160 [Homalodisca vitripennis]